MVRLKNTFLWLLLVLLALAGKAQEDLGPVQTLRGTVIDKQSRFPLPGATVVLLETDPPVGTATDVDGKFRLEEVPVGRVGLQISFLGYNTITLNNIEVTSGKEVVLTVELEEMVIVGDEVEIIAERDKDKPLNKMATVSARTFSVEDAARYAGSFNDPARRASNFAGVNGANDQRNDIIIRGNSPTGLLWRLEGLDIPNPNHFANQGTNGGPVSILNNNLLDNSDFFTGAFPAEYGNSLSGVFDIRMRTGNNEKHEFTGQIGMNGAEFMAEGPFIKGKNSSFLTSYRYSTLDVMDKMGIEFGTSGIPKYQDLSFKLHFPSEKAGVFSIYGLGGKSNIAILAKDKEEEDNSFGLEDDQDAIFGTDMGAIGASHTYFFDKNTHQKIIIGASGMRRDARVDTITPGNKPFTVYQDQTQSGKLSVHYYLNRKFSSRTTMKTGFIADRRMFDLNERSFVGELQTYRKIRGYNGSAHLFQGYMQWQYRVNNQLTLNPGIHYQRFLYNNSQTLEPRLGLQWRIKPGKSLSFGYGYHSQLQLMEVYFYESIDSFGNTHLTNTNLHFTRSHHFVLGYDQSIARDLRLKTEIYYQSLNNVPVKRYSSSFSALNLGADFGGLPRMDSLINEGTGTNYGLEVTLEKFFSKRYYYLITASLFESKYKGSDGVERSSVFNSNYVFNILGGKEFKIGESNLLALNIRQAVAGGKRFTPINLEQSIELGTEVYMDQQAYSEQFEPYYRTDVKISLRRNAKKVTHWWAFDIQNIFNRKNVLMQRYNPLTQRVEIEYQLGIFPVFEYRIQF